MSTVQVECATCNDYRLVDGKGTELVPCPACRPPEKIKTIYAHDRMLRIRGMNKPSKAVANRAPVDFVRCPEHNKKIAIDGEGRLLGRCDGCAGEYAKALRWMKEHPYLRRLA